MPPELMIENAPASSAPPPGWIRTSSDLYKPEVRTTLQVKPELEVLPEPIYRFIRSQPMTKSEYQKLNAIVPGKPGARLIQIALVQKRSASIIPYLFTEWKCNLDCHYCWSYNNKVKE